MPSRRMPVANSQWTCSEGGCIVILEVLQQTRHDDEVEEEPGRDNEQRRLDEQPPEALPVWMEQGDAVRLHERPDHTAERGRRPEGRDDARSRARGPVSRSFEFGDEFCVQDVLLPWSRSAHGP